MSATENKLGALHDLVATVLAEQLKGEKMPDYEDEEGNIVEGTTIPASAAILGVAAKFLKDNEITCAPSDDNSINELQEIMQARLKNRKNKGKMMSDATDDAAFLSGLN